MPRTKKTAEEVKTEVKDTAKKAADKVTAEKIEAKKAVRSTARKAKEKVETAKTATKAKAAARKADVKEVKAAVAAEKKTAKKAAKNEVIIQSPLGGTITPAEILAKTGPVDSVYVRVDENKAYWVKGDENGSVDLW